MKKLPVIMLIIIALCIGCIQLDYQDPVLESLGSYTEVNFYTSGGFQDYTDYAIYHYNSIDLIGNPYFTPMTSTASEDLQAHLENFSEWVDTICDGEECELEAFYTFDPEIISEADYLYIYDDPDYWEFGCYDVYLLDTETNILYYFHNNI